MMLFAMFLSSCEKDIELITSSEAETDRMMETRLDGIRELTDILLELTKQEDIEQEIRDLTMKPVYRDRYVSLDDLLSNKRSRAYTQGKEIRNAGAFQEAFEKMFNEETYPALATYVTSLSNRTEGLIPDTMGLYLYCPYCEDYDTSSPNFTIVPSLENANEGDGYEPKDDGSYSTVTVNDEYAATKPTIIVTPEARGGDQGGGVGPGELITICEFGICCDYVNLELIRCYSEPPSGGGDGGSGSGGSGSGDEDWEDCEGDDAIYLGWLQVTNQWDHFLNVEGNGGGSEMRMSRIGSETMVLESGGQINATSFSATINKFITRKKIRNESHEWWGREFDPGWDCDEVPQKFVHWEADVDAEQTLTGGYEYEPISGEIDLGGIKVQSPSTTVNLGFSVKIQSEDAPIWTQTYEREQYFSRNRLDRDCGTKMTWVGAPAYFDRVEFAKYSCNHGYIQMPDVYFD